MSAAETLLCRAIARQREDRSARAAAEPLGETRERNGHLPDQTVRPGVAAWLAAGRLSVAETQAIS